MNHLNEPILNKSDFQITSERECQSQFCSITLKHSLHCPYYAILKILNEVLEVFYNMFACIQGQKTLSFSHNIQYTVHIKSFLKGSETVCSKIQSL